MECMLQPKNPTGKLEKVAVLDTVEYDGGDWLSYPQRRDKSWPKMDLQASLPLHLYMKSLTNSRELEPFLQTWLLFGLLSEVFGANASSPSEANLKTTNDGPSMNVRWIYDKFTSQYGNQCCVTTATLLEDLETHMKQSLVNRLQLKTKCMTLASYITMTWKVLNSAPKDFNPVIRASIGAVGEILSHSINYILGRFEIPLTCPNNWGAKYLEQETPRQDGKPSVRDKMILNGWCPSDISRSMNKFLSLQLFHFLGNMGRPFPDRNHSKCDDMQCAAYQISEDYEVPHVNTGCGCKLIYADDMAIISILEKENCVPLLKFVGGVDDLKIEVVESSMDTPYVAISHVWADGLGNQDENALYSCQLVRIRTLVEAISQQNPSMKDPFIATHTGETPYIWIDTICCPVGNTPSKVIAKQISIDRIRNVYQDALHVLVLDASLEMYKTQEMDIIEQLLRIFTSGWLRRLWTLQEGVLANSLYFQFADCAISLDREKLLLMEKSQNLRHRIFIFDFLPEWRCLQQFFHQDRLLGDSQPMETNSRFHLINAALQYRSVSFPSDEPLCLGCIMKISTTRMLQLKYPEKDDPMGHIRLRDERMKIFWQLIAEEYQGIPVSIIFFEDARIDARGWRWAPPTLLKTESQLLPYGTRILAWVDKNLGLPTENGLRVKLAGYRITTGQTHHRKGRYIWEGVARLPEGQIFFRDKKTKKLFYIFDKKKGRLNGTETTTAFPINDLLSSRDCYIMQSSVGGTATDNYEGILVSRVPPEETVPPNSSLEGIPVRTHHHVVFGEVDTMSAVFQNVIESLARELYERELTRILQSLSEMEDTEKGKEEYDKALKELKEEMKKLVQEAIEKHHDFGPAIDFLWGSKWRELVWVCVADWFYHDFVIEEMDKEQIWYVD